MYSLRNSRLHNGQHARSPLLLCNSSSRFCWYFALRFSVQYFARLLSFIASLFFSRYSPVYAILDWGQDFFCRRSTFYGHKIFFEARGGHVPTGIRLLERRHPGGSLARFYPVGTPPGWRLAEQHYPFLNGNPARKHDFSNIFAQSGRSAAGS